MSMKNSIAAFPIFTLPLICDMVLALWPIIAFTPLAHKYAQFYHDILFDKKNSSKI